jgi:AAA domain/UvrD-like helicase C-terminal domain
MTLTPTSEQDAILAAYTAGGRLVIEAGAGTGKTSTLRMLAAATPRRRGLYVAYNRAIKDDAAGSFPSNVECRTANSLAWHAVGWVHADKLDRPRQRAADVAAILGIRKRFTTVNAVDEDIVFRPVELARIAKDTITRFCYSADLGLRSRHVPRIPGLSRDAWTDLADHILPFALTGWLDLCDAQRGQLRLDHDHYLKMWHLRGPFLPWDTIFLDEAQDANPVIADAVTSQSHAQLVLVGDRQQQLYAWRGAVDAMNDFDADHRLNLTRSFRFGPAIAAEANVWLEMLGAELRLTGHDPINSTVGVADHDTATAILCRTNAGTIAQIIVANERGRTPALAGGGREIASLAKAAMDLQAGRAVSHPDLLAFNSWGEVREYCDSDTDAGNLATFVRLVDDYGAKEILDLVDGLGAEEHADVTVSTAHKAKGREWDRVLISSDFAPTLRRDPADGIHTENAMSRPDMMLAYVASTRAKHHLDPSGLAWARDLTPAAAL